MKMQTLYFHAECTHCNFKSEAYDNKTQGGVRAAQQVARDHLKECGNPVNVYRDGKLHSTADFYPKRK